jgi:glyoxylase-like metal-dependent hydrolase (beta-lactamase superfamily II)
MVSTFSVGDMVVHRIVDWEGRFEPAQALLPGLTPELLAENRHWLQPLSLDPDDVFRLSVHSYIVRTPHHTILVDSCLGIQKPRNMAVFNMRSESPYLENLAAAGFSVEDIDYVMCTHLHFDHVGWNTRLENGRWVPTFPKARYVFGAEEHAFWKAANATSELPVYNDSVLPIVEAGRADLVEYDFQLGDHVRLLPTPGHTVGHVAVCLGKQKDELVMSGDLMHVPLQTKYPELSFRADRDPAQAATTRRSFLERYCDTGTLCCTAHFPVASVGRITSWDTGFRCNPA